MTLPVALAAVVDLQHAHRELLRVVDGLKPGDWNRGVPYGEHTVKDLVALCIGDMSPSGPGLIAAGVLTPEFIAETSAAFDVRGINRAMVEDRRRFTPEDLRQLLFEAHDARIEATLRLDESHLPVLEYPVPMGEGYSIRVVDWLWYGYADRQHADDIRRTLAVDWTPQHLTFGPEVEEKLRLLVRSHDGLLRAVYSVDDAAWQEPCADAPGWTYHDVLAHLSSNEARRRTRVLSSVLGEEMEEARKVTRDIDGWNDERVAERKDWTVRQMVDEYQLGWHEIRVLLSRFTAASLDAEVIVGPDVRFKAGDFLDRMHSHTSRHAAQLLSASRAARA